jgi:hypothetical protein
MSAFDTRLKAFAMYIASDALHACACACAHPLLSAVVCSCNLQWGYKSIGSELPDGVTLTDIVKSMPQEVRSSRQSSNCTACSSNRAAACTQHIHHIKRCLQDTYLKRCCACAVAAGKGHSPVNMWTYRTPHMRGAQFGPTLQTPDRKDRISTAFSCCSCCCCRCSSLTWSRRGAQL